MTELNDLYELYRPIKGWPVEGAESLQEASNMIFGSPYWEIPEDRYMIIDKNNTYSLLAVFAMGKASHKKRYLVLNMDFLEYTIPITETTGPGLIA
ncbi:MAG: hypothetical protein MUF15_14020 [Acidobacteria bacterium]|jgi:hypothetical protein|nr:hypothetical protein [Acidobacteriota bacterium]